ncbi:MAG TPA: VanZ family protein [Bacteroidales bacterium]|nr:VanZ family protein [Bacteroidales bacterium]
MIRKNIFSILIAIVILYLSLANSHNFDKVHLNIPFADKLVHFGMYFSLMTSLWIENRNRINTRMDILVLSLIPFIYGILMEILQYFTISRSPSLADAAADTAGIVVSLIIWMIVRRSRIAKSE